MEQEYWILKRNETVMAVAYIQENGEVKIGNMTYNDYETFCIDMERYGYEKL